MRGLKATRCSISVLPQPPVYRWESGSRRIGMACSGNQPWVTTDRDMTPVMSISITLLFVYIQIYIYLQMDNEVQRGMWEKGEEKIKQMVNLSSQTRVHANQAVSGDEKKWGVKYYGPFWIAPNEDLVHNFGTSDQDNISSRSIRISILKCFILLLPQPLIPFIID